MIRKFFFLVIYLLVVGCGNHPGASSAQTPEAPAANPITQSTNPSASSEPAPSVSVVTFEELLAAAQAYEKKLLGPVFKEVIPGVTVWTTEAKLADPDIEEFDRAAKKVDEAFRNLSSEKVQQYAKTVLNLDDKRNLISETYGYGGTALEQGALSSVFRLEKIVKVQEELIKGSCLIAETEPMSSCLASVIRLSPEKDLALLEIIAQQSADYFALVREQYAKWGMQSSFDRFYNQHIAKSRLITLYPAAKLANREANLHFSYEIIE